MNPYDINMHFTNNLKLYKVKKEEELVAKWWSGENEHFWLWIDTRRLGHWQNVRLLCGGRAVFVFTDRSAFSEVVRLFNEADSAVFCRVRVRRVDISTADKGVKVGVHSTAIATGWVVIDMQVALSVSGWWVSGSACTRTLTWRRLSRARRKECRREGGVWLQMRCHKTEEVRGRLLQRWRGLNHQVDVRTLYGLVTRQQSESLFKGKPTSKTTWRQTKCKLFKYYDGCKRFHSSYFYNLPIRSVLRLLPGRTLMSCAFVLCAHLALQSHRDIALWSLERRPLPPSHEWQHHWRLHSAQHHHREQSSDRSFDCWWRGESEKQFAC